MTVPAECGEVEDFTPASLKNMPVPPVFHLRAASGREWRRYQYTLRAEGLEYHQADAFRDETLRALRALWSDDEYEANAARLQGYWALVDQSGEPEPADVAAVDELTQRLAKEWRPLASMAADNLRFVDESMKIALASFCIGWSNVGVPYAREAGRVPLAKLDAVEDWLGARERKNAGTIEGVGDPGTAFMEACNAAYGRLHLSGDEEKKSSSPPSPPPARNGFRKMPSRTGSRSKASASSRGVRKASPGSTETGVPSTPGEAS